MERILHINSTIYINSGVMSVVMNYYRNIDKHKIQFDFLYFIKPEDGYKTYQTEIETMGGKVFFIPDFARFWNFNKQLSKLLEKNADYSTVHIHDPFVVRFVYSTLRKHGINNIIVHSHATQWSDKKINGLRNQIICYNLQKYVDYSFACSQAAGEFLYGKNRKFTIINNAIDSIKYKYDAPTRERIRNEIKISDKLVFGHVGNFNNQKNHIFLIDVFKRIVTLNENTCLLLIGDGPLRKEIEFKVHEQGLEKYVLFLGKRMDVENFYQAMDCMILPSLYEGLPMVGVESQCSGLPVLFSDTITKEVGLVKFRFMSLEDTIENWAKSAMSLAQEDLDRSQAVKVIERRGFCINKEAEKLATLYLKMSEK